MCTRKCETINVGGRSVLGCEYGKSTVPGPHAEHDWFSARSGRFVHCYGKGERS